MKRIGPRTSSRLISFRVQLVAFVVAAGALAAGLSFVPVEGRGQSVAIETGSNAIRIGERLTYNVSIGRFPNAAYAELHAVSRGRLADRDAIELRAKFKTLDLASAAVYLIDESRTTFISPSTGLPLHVTVVENATGLPKETNQSFLAAPTPHVDLVTLIYKLRQMGGGGALTIQEDDRVHSVTFLNGPVERHRTDAGEFETTVVSVQSEYFSERGMSDVRVNLSTDDAKIPVIVRFRTSKGAFRMALTSIQTFDPEAAAQPTPLPVTTPTPERTPKPAATPVPYVENQPLAPDLAFELGEVLEYRIVSNNQIAAQMTLTVRERTLFNGLDSLLLEAAFSAAGPASPFAAGDFIRAYVDPETLAPRQVELRFAGALRGYNKIAKFEQLGSVITFGGANRIDAPVGTHSILSLLYAARSFNLKPSRDLNNPINDTRVAVFWESQPHVFTLRPSAPEVITIEGKPVAAQLVSVTTKIPLLDSMNIRIWLANDRSRVPLRFAIGSYQADLVSATKISAK